MRRGIIIAGVVLAVAAGIIYFTQIRGPGAAGAASEYQTETASVGSLTATAGATGTVRPNQSAVLTWQTTGLIDDVFAGVGQRVQEGQELALLSQTSLAQNIILAQADLVNAQKALEDLLNSDTPLARALQAVEDAQTALDNLPTDNQILRAQAQVTLVNALEELEDAQYGREKLDYDRASQSRVDAAEANYILAQTEVDRRQKEFNKVSGRKDNDPVRALALSNLAAAQQQRDSTLRTLNWYRGNPGQDEISEADARLALAQAQVQDAQTAWERLQDGPTEAEVALLQSQLADAQRDLERMRDGVDPDDIAAAEARVAAAQATIDLAHITAPFAGTITEVSLKPGDLISPGTVAFRLDDLSALLVDVQVSEVDINRIQIGQPVSLTFDAILNREYSGRVSEVGQVGNAIQGTVNFDVTVEITDADEQVKPGMTAAVNIVISELDDVLLVPNRAVRVRDGQRVVYVLQDGLPDPVEITLGASSESVSQVIDGDLREGDPIVLNPPSESNFFGGPPGGGGP
jgi:HlyD family secretion protein